MHWTPQLSSADNAQMAHTPLRGLHSVTPVQRESIQQIPEQESHCPQMEIISFTGYLVHLSLRDIMVQIG
jgi:hypothetical protein